MRSILIPLVLALGLCASGAMADEAHKNETQEEAHKTVPKKKKKKKKKTTVHSSAHKVHKEHKVAAVEEEPPAPTPPPAPAPAPEPPPPAPAPEPPKVAVVQKDESRFYAGVGLGSFMMNLVGRNVNGVGGAQRIRGTEFGGYGDVGYNFNRSVALELRAGTIGTERQLQDAGPLFGVPGGIPFTFSADTDAFYSAFVKGTLPVGDKFGVYGLLGATHYKVNLAADIGALRYRDNYSGTDLSYGAGVEGQLGKDVKLGAEYVRYINDTDPGVAANLKGLVGRLQFQF